MSLQDWKVGESERHSPTRLLQCLLHTSLTSPVRPDHIPGAPLGPVHLPWQGREASEPAGGPLDARGQDLRPWERQAADLVIDEYLVHLFALLPRTRGEPCPRRRRRTAQRVQARRRKGNLHISSAPVHAMCTNSYQDIMITMFIIRISRATEDGHV